MNALIINLMAVMLFNPVRPPIPTDVPFAFEQSKCNYEVLAWHVIRQGEPLKTNRTVIELDGQDVTLNIVSSDGSTEIFWEQREKTLIPDDPNNIAVQYKFYMDWRPKVRDDLGIFYIDVKAIDADGDFDARTILVNVVKPSIGRPPIIME